MKMLNNVELKDDPCNTPVRMVAIAFDLVLLVLTYNGCRVMADILTTQWGSLAFSAVMRTLLETVSHALFRSRIAVTGIAEA